MTRRLRTRPRLGLLLAFCALLLGGNARAATQVTVTGPDASGPQAPDANGRFRFDGLKLRKNAVNKFTVKAKDDLGGEITKEVAITQLSLESVVVAKVKTEPLSPERVIQLVEDGVIDLEDPENFNVSLFQIVLTIGQKEVPISVPIAMGKQEETGFESVSAPNDPGRPGTNATPPDTEIIVFDQVVSCDTCVVPPRIPGVIVIEGRIKSLKEFFSVRLLLMNMSGLFTLHDVKASLEFPNGGLSNTLPLDGIVAFDDIGPGDGEVPGQKEREFIIRGDEIGTQPIRVNFGGTVIGPGIDEETPVPFNGGAETSVEVKGPPEFLVRVGHPDRVQAGVPYDLTVEITNNGQAPALYASLDLDIGADAEFVQCEPPATSGANPTCEDVEGPITRQLQHLLPGARVTETFLVRPKVTGDVTSCVGASSQNVTLQVQVGRLGCLSGKIPSTRGVPAGVPTVSVLPYPGALGVSIDSPVTAFFSEKLLLSTVTLGENGSFRVRDPKGNIAPGRIRTLELNGDTVVLWQFEDGITNRLSGNAEYAIELTQDIRDLDGDALFAPWSSTFRTTDPTNDVTPPQLTLGFEPGIDPLHVLPGQLVQLGAYAADQGTGVARIELRLSDQDAPDAPEEFIDQKTEFGQTFGPTIFSLDTGRLVPGHTYQLRASAIDRAGNVQDATIPFVMLTTLTPPSVVLPDDPADPVLQGISLTVTPVSVSAAVKSVAFYLDVETTPFATLTLPPFQTSLVTSPVAAGPHVVRAVATDAHDQTAEDTLAFTLVADTSLPTVSFAGAVDGAQFVRGSQFTVNGSASHAVGIEESHFALDNPNGPALAQQNGSVRIDTAALAEGAHRLYLLATSVVGTKNLASDPASYLEFVVVPIPNGPPPAPPTLQPLGAPVDGKVSVSGTAPPGARVDVVNVTTGLVVSIFAGADGRFSVEIDAGAGDTVRATVLDLSQSQQPSAAAEGTVQTPRVLVAIDLSPATFTLSTPNATRALAVTASYSAGPSEDATVAASYSSSDPSVASVSSGGVVVAKKRGSATITASLSGKTDTANATIEIVSLESIQVTPSPLVLPAVGASQPLTVTGHFNDGTQRTLTSGLGYASSAPGTISVTPAGVVTALAAGSATLTVTAAGVTPVQVAASVDAGADQPPTASFIAPAAGTDFERGQNVSVVVRGTDGVGVARITLTATGATSFSETRQVTPAATATQQTFSLPVASNAPIGGTITLSAVAEDTAGNLSPVVTRTVDVVDVTSPVVGLQAPAPDARFNFGDTITVTVSASDAGGIDRLRFEATGGFTASEARTFPGTDTLVGTSFQLVVPFGVASPDVTLRAFARDVAGNESASALLPITITDADLEPPTTVAVAASLTGAGAVTTVSYQVTSGLADLDHVALYFRRNGLGTFNRYTGPVGSGDGEFTPQSGANGTIAFDATRMGGDGSYEFFTVGVDRAGNREAAPEAGGQIVGDVGVTATIATAAEVVQITSNTELVAANLDGRNLRVSGATLTLVGSHTFRNVELVNGAVLTHRETTAAEGFGIELTAWTLTVDATSRVDVVARGYLGGNRGAFGENGTTAGFTSGSGPAAGGSHGGIGGDYSGNGASVPSPVYGSVANPVDLGAGGGGWSGAGGDGGGRVLLGAINLVVDGSVLANGGLSSGSASGEGAGGTVNLTLRTLSGRGAVRADGGTTNGSNHTGGGGGRVAVRFLDLSTFDTARVTALGGDGTYGDGADGTVYLLAEGATNGELVISGAGAASPFTDLLLPPGQSFDAITLTNGARVIAQGPIVLADTLRLRGNSQLTHSSASEAGLSITATRVEIEAGSAIDVTGRGYPAGSSSGPLPDEVGTTLGSAPGSGRACGGSHGGIGGCYTGNGGAIAGSVYGDPKRPTRLGGGGGGWSGPGGPGGGAIRIVASDALVVHGAIRANGGLSGGSASGDGAGGSVWIETGRLSGTGTISANGGTHNGSSRTGGGGGRVAIEAEFVDPGASLGDLRNVTAIGGDGNYGDGAAGTVFLTLPGDVDGTLFVDAGAAAGSTGPIATELPWIGSGVASAVTASTLTVDGTLPGFLPNALVGTRVNPDLTQGESFTIASNTATTITVVTPNEHGVAFVSVAAVGDRYAAVHRFDDVRFRRGGFLELADRLVVNDTLSLVENGLLTHRKTTQVYAGGLDLEVGSLVVDASGRIDVTGRGYLGGNKTGLGETAHTVGFAAGAQNGTGGSHAGVGGDYSGNGASVTNPTYGSASEPLDLGAGGGAWSGSGGDGGGRIRIVASAIQLDGTIRADGGLSAGSASGEGAGGSVNLRTGTLSGTGLVSASGGTFGGANHTAGGGGRIAIRYASTLGLPLSNLLVVGGDGNYGDGGNGTLFLKSATQANGDLVIDAFGFAQPADSIPIPAGTIVDNLTLGSGVRAVADQGVTVTDTLRVRGGAVLSHSATSELGLQIATRRLVVESGGAIDVSARGYRGGGKTGLGDVAHTLGFAPGAQAGTGGSHGGAGGSYASNGGGLANPLYGDPRRPDRLGSGGGGWGGSGGDGGGAVHLVATESVVVDGAIRANGGVSSGSASGEGSGGSIWIETPRLGGLGTISADGPSIETNHTGGGGGRVALYIDELESGADFDGLRDVTARGSDAWYDDGAAGTVYVELGGVGNGALYFDGIPGSTVAEESGLPPIGPGRAAAVTPSSLTVDGRLRAFTPAALVGLRLNPDTTQAQSFRILANTANTISVATPNENGVSFASVAAPNDRYAASWHFDDVVLRRSAVVALHDPLVVDGAVLVGEGSVLTHPRTTASYEPWLDLDAGTLEIDPTSRIDVNGRGYLGGGRSGLGEVAHTVGFAPGAPRGTGGSHGGIGGDYSGNGASVPIPAYGVASEPVELGSGGGAWGGNGADGGGRVRITCDALVVDGAITANGAVSTGSASGEGSGGSINVRTGSIAGTGPIRANGGSTGGADHTGGGGGRVAVRYTSGPAPVGPVSAAGGDGFYSDGQPGSVFVQGP